MGRGPFNGHSRDVNCVTFSPDTSWSDDKMIRFLELCTRKEQSAIVEETLIVLEKSSLVNDRGNGLFTDGCKRDKDGWLSGGRSELLFWTPPHNYSTPENEVKKKTRNSHATKNSFLRCSLLSFRIPKTENALVTNALVTVLQLQTSLLFEIYYAYGFVHIFYRGICTSDTFFHSDYIFDSLIFNLHAYGTTKSRGGVICTNSSPNSSSPSVVAFVLSWVYSSSRPRNRGGHVVVLSKLAFTTDAEAHGGIGGNMLMTLPLNWSVGSAVVVSGLLKSHTTSLTRPLLSSCCGQSSL